MGLTYQNTSKKVKTESGTIHYHEVGTGETVILLHGSGPGASGWANYAPNIPYLAERYHVIAADMPGWGESDPVTYRDRDHPTAVANLMDALGIGKATLVGNSMGGGTTIRFGYEHPDRVNKLITMGASMGGPTLFGPAGFSEGLKILQQGYREPTFETMRTLVQVMTYDSAFATDDLIQQRADTTASFPEHNKNFIEGIGKRAIVELDHAKVATITAPTLLFHGRDDRVVHFENSLRLVQLIPNSRMHLINRCGHWLQIEHFAEFNRLVDDFVRNG